MNEEDGPVDSDGLADKIWERIPFGLPQCGHRGLLQFATEQAALLLTRSPPRA